MNLHLVVAAAASEGLEAVIRAAYPDDSRQIAPNQWVIAADITDRALCERLGAAEGQFGRIMVATFSTYYGWHDKELWNWLSLKEGR